MAVYHHGLDPSRGICDALSPRRVETGGLQLVEDCLLRERELLEGFRGQDARAVDRLARGAVFLQERDGVSLLRQATRGIQAARSAADDDRVVHSAHSF